jgi:hypothetical protein
MITFTGLCDLNSIVIPRLGFPFSKIFFSKFSFQISKINNLKALGLDHAFLVEFPFSFKNNKIALYLYSTKLKLEANIYISLGVLLSTK